MTEEKERKVKRLVLLDAHAILHRAYHALPEFSTSKGEPTGALYGLAAMLIKIVSELKPDYLIAAYDLPKPTHRHEVYKDYKAGRPKAEPDLISQMKRSREIFDAFNIKIYDKEGFEADDILGTIVEKLKDDKKIEIIIASGDMDTLQLVEGKKVMVYTLKKGIQDTILYDEEAVVKRFGFGPKLLPDYKGLSGDPSDNIIGIKGIGDKTATTLLLKFGTIEEIYKVLKQGREAFIEEGIKPRVIDLLTAGEEEAEFSKILATIRRDAPIDFSLPEKVWNESVDMEKAKALFAELEFRNLGSRLGQVLGGKAEEKKVESTQKGQMLFGQMNVGENKTLSVALWLLNSAVTSPTQEDILNFTGAKSVPEAEKIIMDEIKKKGLSRVYEEIEAPLIPIVEKINRKGIKINVGYLKELGLEYHKVLSELEKKIWNHAGSEFNINSPKQMGEILFVKMGLKAKNQKKTSTGALSTKESELDKMKEMHPIIPLILEYRELAKLLSTYIDNIPQMVGLDGRLHAKLLQAGTTTGRMSSEEPNLQNIPNHTSLGLRIRHAFVADEGFKLVAVDYSQIELRIAAFLSGDKNLIEIFKKGQDVHSAVASFMFNIPQNEVTKEMRRQAKVINFGVLYGMGINALRANLGTDRPTAQKFYDNYFATFSGLAKYLDGIKADAERKGYTETFFGRRRYFEGLKSRLPFIRAAAERMAINAPIQGTGADMIKLSMINIDKYLEKEKLDKKVSLVLQVHDELVYEVKDELVGTVSLKIKEVMEGVIRPEEIKDVPIVADVSVGKNWGEMEKMKD